MVWNFHKVKLSWTKYDIVRIVDIVNSRDMFEEFYTKKIKIDEPIMRAVIGINSYDEPIPSFWNDLFEMNLKVRKAFMFWWIIITNHAIADRFKTNYTKGIFIGEYHHEYGKVETNLRSLIFKCEITNVQDKRCSIVPFDSSFLISTPGIQKVIKSALENYFSRHCIDYTIEGFNQAWLTAEIHKIFGFEDAAFNKWISEESTSIRKHKIESLHLSNFLCFKESIDICFEDSNEIYFYGENGTGKTSILKALFLAFGAYSILQKPEEIKTFSLIVNMLSKMGNSTLIGKDSEGKESKIDKESDIPLIIAFGSNRNVYKNQEDNKIVDTAVCISLFCRDIILYNPTEALKCCIGANNAIDGNNFRKLIQEITYEHIDIIFENQQIKYYEDGEIRDFSEISGGFQSLLILLANILVILYRKPTDTNIFQRNGVVLVDIIEQGLHPSIQVGLISKIRKYFPNLQFIMTTCSQDILDSASHDSRSYTLIREDGTLRVLSNSHNPK